MNARATKAEESAQTVVEGEVSSSVMESYRVVKEEEEETSAMENSGTTTEGFDEQLPATVDHCKISNGEQQTEPTDGGKEVEQETKPTTDTILENENKAAENDQRKEVPQKETITSNGNIVDYNLFLSYAWGKDHQTHDKVKILADFLIQQGEHPFFDHNNLRGNMKDKISEVLANSPIFVTVLTKEYNEKVKGQLSQDYVYFELNYSSEVCNQKILIILEESMRDRKKWCARLQGEFANMLYIDLCNVDWKDKDTNNHSFTLFMEEVRRLAKSREKKTSQL
jgi:hypothetical protein